MAQNQVKLVVVGYVFISTLCDYKYIHPILFLIFLVSRTSRRKSFFLPRFRPYFFFSNLRVHHNVNHLHNNSLFFFLSFPIQKKKQKKSYSFLSTINVSIVVPNIIKTRSIFSRTFTDDNTTHTTQRRSCRKNMSVASIRRRKVSRYSHSHNF